MKLLYKAVFALYLLTLIWLVLFKFSLDLSSIFGHQLRSLNLIPFADFSKKQVSEMIYNFIVFIPFGLFLQVNFKEVTFRRKLAYIFWFSVAAEVIQFIFEIGATDITDVITNTCGGLLGLGLYNVCKRRMRDEKIDRRIVTTSAVLLVLLIGIIFLHTVPFRLEAPDIRVPLHASLSKNVHLTWPAKGHAAIGSVEGGLLARSSDREKPQPTASMAKVITALAIMEKQPLKVGQTGPTYTVTAEDVANYRAYVARGGSVVPVHEGMTMTQYQAMQAMLIPSANNIADLLVERIFGSTEAYASYVQDMLHRMGLRQTMIADASGFDPDTVSTPSELVIIGIAALKDPVIAEITAQPQAEITGIGTVINTNELLGTGGVIGIKTGTTDQAGDCLLFAARYITKDGHNTTIVGVIMGDTDVASLFDDSQKLLVSVKQGLGLAEAQSTDDGVSPPRHMDRAPR
jgi:D-alanyl-D-alanine carboxypeptidase (penicillin-binding protein 5/6)